MASGGTTLQHDHILTHSVSTTATISDTAATSGNTAHRRLRRLYAASSSTHAPSLSPPRSRADTAYARREPSVRSSSSVFFYIAFVTSLFILPPYAYRLKNLPKNLPTAT